MLTTRQLVSPLNEINQAIVGDTNNIVDMTNGKIVKYADQNNKNITGPTNVHRQTWTERVIAKVQ